MVATTICAQPKKEEPVGLIMSASGAKLLRSGAETALAAKPGDILFAGDVLKADSAAARFAFCPSKSSQALDAGGDVLLEAKQIKVRSGKLSDQKPMGSCFLPQMARVSIASQQHYGVSMVRGLKDPTEPTATPRDKWPPALAAEMADVDKAIAADPADQTALVARATLFEKHNLLIDALATYKKIGQEWKDAVWVKGKIFDLSEALASAAAAKEAETPADGKTFALLIGVSKYQKLAEDQWLQFASADAMAFEKLFRSPRGGALPAENVLMLTDEKATTAALRNAFQTFLKGRAGKKDTVLILIAGHGTVEVPGSKGAYILTHDSDPQDLPGTAMPMADVQALVQEELSKVGRVALFVDVCRAGNIGSIKNNTVNGVVEKLGEVEQGSILGLMASRPKEFSREGAQFGGGHGAFSYFLLKALNGAADDNGDGKVDVSEIIEYLQREVPKATNKEQHPRDFGNMDNKFVLSDVKKPGIDITHAEFPVIFDSGGERVYLAQTQATAGVLSSEAIAAISRLTAALDKRRNSPDDRDGAFAALRELKSKLTADQYLTQENRLRVALEDQGQQVILKYLTGDQIPQTRQDFENGADYYRAAAVLTPESLYLEGRESFCRGRSLLYAKDYAKATELLENAVRIDPQGAHAYNALGIAYLEKADYAHAIPAFRDAVRRAPHWAYPLHNLALAYVETGDYSGAIRSYQQAIRLTPQYSYLPYNLGLVYQRLNRRKDAELSYRKALALSPELSLPYNALGSLKAASGHAKEAETFYRQALQKDPKLLAARHNLALLLTENKDRAPEALILWRENLKQSPEFLPSRLSLAAALPDPKDAIVEYRGILAMRGDYVAARLALATLLEKTGDAPGALVELREAAKLESRGAAIQERIGDLEQAAGRTAEAKAAYDAAIEQAPDSQAKKRLRRKLK